MADYSFWEVILNGDSPVPTRIVEGILQPVAPITVEQKLARKNELKARGTLLMALPDKHQLKFNSHKDAKTLMEAIEKRFGGNTKTKKVQKTLLKQQYENFTGSSFESLDQIHDRLQKLISQLKIHEVSLSQEDVNLKFLRSLPSEWKTHTFIWSNKADLEEQSLDDLFNNLKIYEAEMAMLTMPARRFLQKTSRNLGANGPTSMGYDMSNVECYNSHRKGHFSWECRSPKDSRRNGAAEPHRRTVPVETFTSNALVSQCDGVGSYDWSYQAEEETANYALMAFSSLISSSDNELSPTKTAQDLSHTNRPTAPIIKDWVSNSEDESETKAPQIVPSFIQSFKQVKSLRHSIKHVETSTPAATPKPSSPKSNSSSKRRSRKACFVCKSVDNLIKDCDYHAKKLAQPTPRTHAHRGNYKQYAPLTHTNHQKHMVPAVVLSQSKLVSITAVRPVSVVVPKIKVTRPRHVNPIVTKSKLPIRRHITRSPSLQTSNSPPRVTAVKASVGNLQHALKDNGVIDSGCSRYMTGNMSYLSDFEELNGGYVYFGGNPNGGKIFRKGKIKTGKVDEGFLVGYSVNSKAFRVFNSRTRFVQETLHVNFLENKPNVAGSGPTWLFDIDSLTRTMNYQPVIVGNQTNPGTCFQNKFDADKAGEEINQQYVLFLCGLLVLQILRTMMKMLPLIERSMILMQRSQSLKDLSTEFKDCSNNSINEVNAAGTIVPTVRQNSLNNTNIFSAVGPSNVTASLTYGKSSFIDASKANFNNLDTSITKVWILVDLPHGKRAIATKWVFRNQKNERGIVVRNKARLVAQGHTQEEGIDYEEVFAPVAMIEAIRLFLAYASFMGFMMYQMDVKSAFLYETIEEEIYVYQPLRGKIDQTLFIKRQKGDILLVQIYVDDIIFGATNKDLCKSFEKLMKDKFQMSLMGELTFFLRLQVKQKKDGIFISQDKYVAEILRKFGLTEGKLVSTPIDTEKPLLKDPDGGDVDVHTYSDPKSFTPSSSKEDLWIPQVQATLELVVNDVTRLQALVDRKKVVVTEAMIREALHLDDVEGMDCLPNEEIFEELARIGYEKPSTKLTFYKVFFLSQWKFLIHTILQCMSAKRTSLNEFSSLMASAVICLSSGKGFFRVETPLFEGMLVEQEIVEEGDTDEHVEEVNTTEGDDSAAHGEVLAVTKEPSIPSPTPPTLLPQPPQDIPSTSQKLEKRNKVRVLKLRRLHRVGTSQRVDTSDDTVMDDESNQGRMIVEIDQDDVVVLKDDKEEDKEVADKDVEEAKVDESAQVQGRQAES
uniref:Uncharacterized protein n=1 Tax=Tanacetum cinerariifolium TaxID=118510 RepID=A0A6L2KJC4_TANCI|nr:hypothetical protein [Tanacetum cinerariifolium]